MMQRAYRRAPMSFRQARRRRLYRVGIASFLTVWLAACDAQNGTTAVQLNPIQLAPAAGATPAGDPGEAPRQRWGTAAGLDPVAGGPRNTFRPPSTRAQYPVVAPPQLPAGAASVQKAPQPEEPDGFRAGASREIGSERDAHRRTYENPDGSRTTEFSTVPVNYRKADGTWAPIDSTLVAQPDGSWRRSTDAVDLRLAGDAAAADLVRVTLPSGGVLAYRAVGATAVPATVAGDTARYVGAWPGVDMELQAQPGGVKETLVLASAAATRTFTFPLRLTGLTAAVDGDRVVLRDKAGAVAAVIPPATSPTRTAPPRRR